jgi:hypothetical protein
MQTDIVLTAHGGEHIIRNDILECMKQVKNFFGNRIVKRVLWQSGAYLLATALSIGAVQLQAWQPSNGIEFISIMGALAVVLQNISKELNTWLAAQKEEGAGGGIA